MREELEKELEKIGLSEKEAKVYLAGLESGPSTAQQLAAKATVNRPTTYIMIESLIKRGLMSSFEKGKKRYFVAAAPRFLRSLNEQEQKTIQEKLKVIENLLPKLSSVALLTKAPIVTLYEGLEGLKNLQTELIITAKKSGEIDNIAAVESARETVSEKEMQELWDEIIKNKIRVRTIYTNPANSISYPGNQNGLWQVHRLPKDKFPFEGEVSIFGNRVAALSLKGKTFGVIIESKEIADTLKALFELAWQASENYPV